MEEHSGKCTFNGNALTLLGQELNAGDQAPDFELVNADLSAVSLADFKDKVKIICTVPSLDTPVCELETIRFNREAASLSDQVEVIFVSMDLPSAQKRFCAAKQVDKVTVLSDYRSKSFAQSYGVLIKELQLLTRAVFVINPHNTITYAQHISEITSEPEYEKILAEVKKEIPIQEVPSDGFCGAY